MSSPSNPGLSKSGALFASDLLSSYKGYRGLPPLAGLESMSDAAATGLMVAESVDRLKRLHWALRRLHEIFVSRITSEPIYELKMAFSLHGFYCSEHVGEFAGRVREMRQPPHGLEVPPDAALSLFFDEIAAAPTTPALLLGLYTHAVPAVVRGLENLIADTNKLFDHPTYRICRLTLLEMKDVQAYGVEAVGCIVDSSSRAEFEGWTSALDQILAAAGDLDGTKPRGREVIGPIYSGAERKYNPLPQRDERFQDPYNMGVNAEAFLFDESIPAFPKLIMLFFKRMREIDVPEMMASILAETGGKPWGYYRDMTRQLWDEARHAMMGELGFASMGIDWTKIPLNFTWSLGLNTMLTAKERHAVLYTIEQGLMPKRTGKQYEWEVAVASKNRLAAMIQDYDWADEVLHARIGREWLVDEIGSQVEALAYGDKAWSKVLVDWKKWKESGLTEHRNWWPEIYTRACEQHGVPIDPKLLGYDTTYEKSRADQKEVAS